MAKERTIDDELENIDLSEKTEMEGVAEQIFKEGDSRSNLFQEEIALILTCDLIFPVLGMDRHNPTGNFKNLAKSRKGWSTEKFVEAASRMQNSRSGGTMGGWMKERLFSQKQ